MRLMIAAAGMLTAGIAAAAPVEMKATNELPFKIEVKGVEEAQGYAVVTVDVANGSDSNMNVDLHCLIGNAEGYTWHARGKAGNIDPKSKRTVRVVGTLPLDAYSQNPTQVHCLSPGFSAPMLQAD